jgi:hypothetical protein
MKSILIPLCSTTKCGKSQVVWILSVGTVDITHTAEIQQNQPMPTLSHVNHNDVIWRPSQWAHQNDITLPTKSTVKHNTDFKSHSYAHESYVTIGKCLWGVYGFTRHTPINTRQKWMLSMCLLYLFFLNKRNVLFQKN